MKSRLLRLFVAAVVLVGCDLVFAAAPTVGDVAGSPLKSVAVGPILQGAITINVSGATQFGSSDFDGWGDDAFNGMWVKIVQGLNVSDGSWVLITDYLSSTGTFTTLAADGSWALGDRIKIYDAWAMLAERYPGARYPLGVITVNSSSTDATPTQDTLTIPSFSTIDQSQLTRGTTGRIEYYLRVFDVDDNADSVFLGQFRPLETALGSNQYAIAPGFSVEGSAENLDAGDVVELVPFADINGNLPFRFRGTSVSGSATTAVFPELAGRLGAIVKDSFIKCIVDDAGSDEGDVALVSALAADGTVTFTTGVLTPTVSDFFEITWTPAGEFMAGANGAPHLPVAAHFAAGVNIQEALAYASNAADSADVAAEYVRSHIDDMESDADTTELRVQQMHAEVDSLQKWGPRPISVSGLTGTAAADSLTCFTVTAGDIWVTDLSLEVTTGAGATAELANFCAVLGTAGGVIVRLGEGKDLNNLAAGVVEWLAPATAVLTDSLGYVRNAASATSVIMSVTPWRMRLPQGSIIKLLLPGSSIVTGVKVNMTWQPATAGAAVS